MSIKTIIKSQSDETWAELNKKLMEHEINYNKVLTEPLYQFIDAIAKSVGTNIGFVLPSILTTINYLASSQNFNCEIRDGQPSTGKSPAIKVSVSNPLTGLDLHKELISCSTSSGLTKLLSKIQRAFIVNPEIQEYLLKIIKQNDENAASEVEILCKVFSGESCTFNYGTENRREISSDTTLCILGATQIKTLALLLSKMDMGNGLIDRFIISIPTCYRPLPEEQSQASTFLKTKNFKIDDIYEKLAKTSSENTQFYFDDDAQKMFDEMEKNFLIELNDNLKNGRPTQKNKTTDVIPKLAVAIHLLEHIFLQINSGRNNTTFPESITLQTMQKANYYSQMLTEQKEFFNGFVSDMVCEKKIKTIKPPTLKDYTIALLNMPGRIVTYRSYKQCASKRLRSMISSDYKKICEDLVMINAGKLNSVRLNGQSEESYIFVKLPYDELPEEVKSNMQKNTYLTKYEMNSPKSITQNIIDAVQDILQ
ncbi:uncharacterized protein LOC130613599 [Hydractinia symbiolongicarpus]|uniref:uncharacterized protein LOC130613599 n=1 Tax=Hydractinia symbiolongicarpus TaxID=13093 RepID=UPI00254A99E4|nr:uncharacterized protein LOC130613599 [Hydractinia symbiolongicarpus]